MAAVEGKNDKPKVTHYLRVLRLIPICPVHDVPMLRYSAGDNSTPAQWFRCGRIGENGMRCKCTGSGSKRILPN